MTPNPLENGHIPKQLAYLFEKNNINIEDYVTEEDTKLDSTTTDEDIIVRIVDHTHVDTSDIEFQEGKGNYTEFRQNVLNGKYIIHHQTTEIETPESQYLSSKQFVIDMFIKIANGTFKGDYYDPRIAHNFEEFRKDILNGNYEKWLD